jgi:hypothetical protein
MSIRAASRASETSTHSRRHATTPRSSSGEAQAKLTRHTQNLPNILKQAYLREGQIRTKLSKFCQKVLQGIL